MPSSAIASACPVEKIRFLRVSPPTRKGVKRWRNVCAMGHSMYGSGRPVNGPEGASFRFGVSVVSVDVVDGP